MYHKKIKYENIVMGNERRGMYKKKKSLVKTKLLIPKYYNSESKTESINGYKETGIICSEFRRR